MMQGREQVASLILFFFSSRRRHTISLCDWSSDVCSSDLRGGIMDIDEFAHAVGVIFCRPPRGELDLAPGSMDVDADEEIDGAVAAIFAIVAFELARLGRDRLANLAH